MGIPASSIPQVRLTITARLTSASPDDVARAVGAHVTEMCQSLGLPANVDVKVVADEEGGSGGVALVVNDRPCRYDRLNEAILADHIENAGTPEGESEYIALVCDHALRLQLEVLIDAPRLDDWRAHLPAALSAADASVLLTGLVDAWIRVDDYGTIGELAAADRSIGERLENCLARLSTKSITVRVSSSYLDALRAGTDESEIVEKMRETLYEELGVLCPGLNLELDPALTGRAFVMVANALSGTPHVGIGTDQIHVNDTPDRLSLMNVEARPCLSPDQRRPGAVVPGAKREVLEAAGLTVLGPLEYLASVVQSELSRHAALLVHFDALQPHLKRLETAFPDLVAAATAAVPVWQIAAALRELVRSGVSVRKLNLVFERIVDFPSYAHPANRHTVFDDSISVYAGSDLSHDLVSFLRAGLARQIADVCARRTRTVVVYLLDESVYAALHGADQSGRVEVENAILKAFEAERSHLPATAQTPHILASAATARRLRPVFRITYPYVAVLSCMDLPPDVNIQPVARISL